MIIKPIVETRRWVLNGSFSTINYKQLFKNLWVVLTRWYSNGFYLDYSVYNNKMVFLDKFYFQQKVRRDNIKNIKGVGTK